MLSLLFPRSKPARLLVAEVVVRAERESKCERQRGSARSRLRLRQHRRNKKSLRKCQARCASKLGLVFSSMFTILTLRLPTLCSGRERTSTCSNGGSLHAGAVPGCSLQFIGSMSIASGGRSKHFLCPDI
jgi:hypothetical protein